MGGGRLLGERRREDGVTGNADLAQGGGVGYKDTHAVGKESRPRGSALTLASRES